MENACSGPNENVVHDTADRAFGLFFGRFNGHHFISMGAPHLCNMIWSLGNGGGRSDKVQFPINGTNNAVESVERATNMTAFQS